MATTRQTKDAAAPQEEVVNVVVEETASVTPGRFFTIPGRDPFDEIEWELRDAIIPGKDGPAFEQRNVEFPRFWSQTATNIVAQKYFRGRLSSPERERSVKQMVGRVVDTIGGWGRAGGYFATDDEADTFEAELKAILVNQYASFNSPVWFNVGFEEKPQCSACFILSIDDTMDSILDWIRREGVIFRGGSGSGLNLSKLRSSKEQLSKGGYASRPGQLHARRRLLRRDDQVGRQDAARGQDGRARRRPPGRRGVHLVQGEGGAEGARPRAGGLRHVARLARLGLDPVPEREQLGPRQRRLHGGVGRGQGVEPHRPHRRLRRRDDRRARSAPADRRGGVAVRRPGRPVRHDDQQLAHAAEHRPDQRVEPVLGVHVDRRLRVQPLLAQPDEVPARGRRVRRRRLRARRRRDVPRAGDLRRLLLVPDARDRREREGVPPARARLREPRRPADGAWVPVRLRRRPRLRGGDHGADDRPRLPQVGRDRAADGPVRRLPAERGRDDRRDREAPRRGREHPGLELGAGGPAHGGPAGLGRRARQGRGARLPERAGDRARSDRDDQLHDGLRHDGRGARLLARQVEEARRRRRDHDREQDRAARRSRSSATRRARSTRSWRSSTSATRSSAPRTSRASTTRSSTAPSATARSTTWVT